MQLFGNTTKNASETASITVPGSCFSPHTDITDRAGLPITVCWQRYFPPLASISASPFPAMFAFKPQVFRSLQHAWEHTRRSTVVDGALWNSGPSCSPAWTPSVLRRAWLITEKQDGFVGKKLQNVYSSFVWTWLLCFNSHINNCVCKSNNDMWTRLLMTVQKRVTFSLAPWV